MPFQDRVQLQEENSGEVDIPTGRQLDRANKKKEENQSKAVEEREEYEKPFNIKIRKYKRIKFLAERSCILPRASPRNPPEFFSLISAQLSDSLSP